VNIVFGKGSGHYQGTKCACVDAELHAGETLTLPAQIDKTNWLSTHSNGNIRTNGDTFTATMSPGGTCTDSQTYICAARTDSVGSSWGMSLEFTGEVTLAARAVPVAVGSNSAGGAQCVCVNAHVSTGQKLSFPAQIDRTNWNVASTSSGDTFAATVVADTDSTCSTSQTYVCATRTDDSNGSWGMQLEFTGEVVVDYSAFAEESKFTLELNDVTVADVQANLPMYRNGVAASLNVSPDQVSIVVSTAARRRLTGGAVLSITVVSLTANDATNVQIVAQAPAFVAAVATELSVSASAIAVDATTCSVACTFATTVTVTHDTTSQHTHHRCYVDHSDNVCKCTCCNSATSDCSSAVNFLA
jgi:hypothetical protein